MTGRDNIDTLKQLIKKWFETLNNGRVMFLIAADVLFWILLLFMDLDPDKLMVLLTLNCIVAFLVGVFSLSKLSNAILASIFFNTVGVGLIPGASLFAISGFGFGLGGLILNVGLLFLYLSLFGTLKIFLLRTPAWINKYGPF